MWKGNAARNRQRGMVRRKDCKGNEGRLAKGNPLHPNVVTPVERQGPRAHHEDPDLGSMIKTRFGATLLLGGGILEVVQTNGVPMGAKQILGFLPWSASVSLDKACQRQTEFAAPIQYSIPTRAETDFGQNERNECLTRIVVWAFWLPRHLNENMVLTSD